MKPKSYSSCNHSEDRKVIKDIKQTPEETLKLRLIKAENPIPAPKKPQLTAEEIN